MPRELDFTKSKFAAPEEPVVTKSPDKPLGLTKLMLSKVTNKLWCEKAHAEIRRLYKLAAYCAATQSYLLIHCGVLTGVRVSTQDYVDNGKKIEGLDGALRARGWVRGNVMGNLMPGDLVWMEDMNQDTYKRSDHVVLFVKWIDQARCVALIWDNQHKQPASRNLLKRTPYFFHMRPA